MRTRSRRPVLGCAVGAGLLLALIALGAYQFNQYGAAVAQLAQKAAPIMIAITDPHTGQAAAAGTSLLVHAEAGGPNPLTSLELWVDGQLVGIQAAPGGAGLTAFSADFAWTPAAPGTYSLVARALNADAQSADSAAVLVIVGESTKPGGGAGGDMGQSLPIANGGGGGGSAPQPLPPPPALPDASDSIGPAQTWSLSVGDWLTGGNEAPLAPELTAVPAGCGATLSIHDLSEGEDGFIVFRMTDSAPMMTKIATLAGQSDLEWLTYMDASYTAENSYMVRAFDGAKVTDSNIAHVQGNPEDCAQAVGPMLSIKLTSLQTGVDADDVYCYKSLNGTDWSRWPVAGFITPGPDDFDIQESADAVLLDELNGKTLSLDLECWGWVGGALQLLGKLHRDGIGPDLGVAELSSGDLQAGIDFAGPITTKAGDPPPKPPTGPAMPKIFAILFYGPDACTEHLPPDIAGNPFLAALFCSWFPDYNFDQGESQPYLVWYVIDGHCLNGTGDVCAPFQSYLDRAAQYGGTVGFNVYGQLSDSIPIATTPHDMTAYVVPPQSNCGEDTLFMTVRMFFLPGPSDPEAGLLRESLDSNTVSSVFNCPPPEEVKLDVIFDTLHIADLDDGVLGGDDLEVYASFAAEGKNPGSGSVLNLGFWGWSSLDCPDDALDIAPADWDANVSECPWPVEEGAAAISDFLMCTSNTYSQCVGPRLFDNNKIQVTVGDGSQIRVAIHAMDYDADSSDDNVCQAETWIGPESIFGWQGYTANGSMSQGDNGSASCTVSFHVAPAP